MSDVSTSISSAPDSSVLPTGDSKGAGTNASGSLAHTCQSMYTGTYPFLFFSCYQCKCGFSSTEVDGIALHCYTAGLEAGRAEDAKRRIESAAAAAPTVVVRGQDTSDSNTTRSGAVYNTNTVPTGTVYRFRSTDFNA